MLFFFFEVNIYCGTESVTCMHANVSGELVDELGRSSLVGRQGILAGWRHAGYLKKGHYSSDRRRRRAHRILKMRAHGCRARIHVRESFASESARRPDVTSLVGNGSFQNVPIRSAKENKIGWVPRLGWDGPGARRRWGPSFSSCYFHEAYVPSIPLEKRESISLEF